MWFRTSHREPVYTTFHFHTTQRTPLWPGTCCHQAPCAVTSEVISILPLRASCVQAPSGGICLVVWKSTTGGFPLCYKHSDRIEVVIYESYQKGIRGSIRNLESLVCDVHWGTERTANRVQTTACLPVCAVKSRYPVGWQHCASTAYDSIMFAYNQAAC